MITHVIGVVSGRWNFSLTTRHAIPVGARQVGTRQTPHSVYHAAIFKAECGRTAMRRRAHSDPLADVPYVVGDSFYNCKTCDRKVQGTSA